MIKNYPEYYAYFKETSFTWDRTGGEPIKQGNRNPLLYKNIGADGIKTGFLTIEKYSLAASVKKKTRRMIAVGSGFTSKNSRSRESIKVFNWGFNKFDTIQIAKKDEIFTSLKTWLGKKNKVDVVSSENIYLTIPKRKIKSIKVFLEYNGPIQAPINEGDIVGILNIYEKDVLVRKVNLLSAEDIKKSNIFSRLFKSLNYLVWGDV
jgi:D-alanyl-D-alanine carboxypeptidase (penicillin-binding protein 5/6)